MQNSYCRLLKFRVISESSVLPSSGVERSEQFLRDQADALHPNNGIMVAMKAR